MSAKAKVLNAFYAIADSSHHYQDKWISDLGWTEIITTLSPNKVKDIENLRTVVVKSLNSLAGKFDSSNVNKVLWQNSSRTALSPLKNGVSTTTSAE